jgi:hypothetical protein
LSEPSRARAQQIQIESIHIEHDTEKKRYRYRDARFRLEELSLDAQLIEIDLEQKRAFATGQVRYRYKEVTGTAERIEVNLADKSVTLFDASLFDTSNGFYLAAEKVVRVSPERYVATNCSLTSCTPKKGGWTLEAGEIDYRTNDFATGSNNVLNLGPVPIFWFPYIAWPTVNERRSGFLAPRLSTEDSSLRRFDLGTRLKVPFYWVLGVDHDLTITPDIIEQRGLALDFDYNYAFWQQQTGKIRLFHIDESFARNPLHENPVGDPPAGGNFKPTRETLNLLHNQGFGDNRRLILSLAHSSDGQVLREYFHLADTRPRLEYEASYAVMTGWGELALTAWHGSEFQSESVFADSSRFADGRLRPRLSPRATYSTGGRLFRSSRLGLDVVGRLTNFTTAELLSGRASEVRSSLAYPIALGGSWELRPSVSRRFVQFDGMRQSFGGQPESELPSESFAQSEYEVELRAPFARMYLSGQDGAAAVKHRITPRLIYYEVEDVAQPLSGSLNLSEAENLAGGGSEDFRAGVIPSLFTQQLLTFRLDNAWLRGSADGGKVRAREWIRLDFIQRYNLLLEDEQVNLAGPAPDPDRQETEPGEPLLPAILDASISGGGLRLGLLLHYHHQLNTFNQTEISVRGKVSPRGTMRVRFSQNDFKYRTPDNRLIPGGSRLRLNSAVNASEAVTLGFSGTVNVRDSPAALGRRLEAGQVFLDYHPGCYSLRVSFLEALSFTRVDGEPEFIIDRRLVFTFNLGGLFTATSTQELRTGG